MSKLILKPTGEDSWGRETYVSVTGHPYKLVGGVIYSVEENGELGSPVSDDNGNRVTMKGVKLCD